jgi:hypothetical protein
MAICSVEGEYSLKIHLWEYQVFVLDGGRTGSMQVANTDEGISCVKTCILDNQTMTTFETADQTGIYNWQ